TATQLGDLEQRRGEPPRGREAHELAPPGVPGFWVAPQGPAPPGPAPRPRARAPAGGAAPPRAHPPPPRPGAPGAPRAPRPRPALGRAEEAEATWLQAVEAAATAERLGAPDRRALALFLADHGREPERAVAVAREELALYPTLANEDALAWALSRAGHRDEA